MSEREIFLAVLDLPAASRTEYLDMACGADAAMRNRIDALLNSHEGAGSFLGTPAVARPDPDSAATRTFGHESGSGAKDEVPLGFLSPATRPDSLGRIGHYEILQVLGQGGFGIVFRAFDDVLHRIVAVKVLSPQMAATSPARKRFLREARSSAQVRHENVVQAYEVGEHPLPYIVMEFIPGETLQQRLDRTGPVDVAEVVRVGRQIAEGLSAAHANDLIHRDIKPGNILLESGAQRVKITDFGLARAADDASISQSGIIAGTPMYMAPEQALGQKLDQRADLFSLGSVLYQMAAGRPPFRANGTVAVLKRVAEDTPRDIREITPETPQWLCDIIAKLHAKNPDDRYQSAREVADVLADCEAQLKENAKLKDYSRIPRRKTSERRSRWWTLTVAIIPILAGATVVALKWPLLQRDDTRNSIDKQEPPVQSETLQSPPLAVAPFDAVQAKAYQDAWAKYLNVPVEIENTIGMKLRLIPAGKFLMGTADSDPNAWNNTPQHEVTVTRPFFAGAHEVTVGQFRLFAKESGYRTEAEQGVGAFGFMGVRRSLTHDRSFSWTNTGLKQADDHPVVCVTVKDALAFCQWLSKKEGHTYALLSEAQWEYCCRAGTRTQFSFGDDVGFLDLHGWYDGNSGETTHPVGKKEPNAWGLFDMYGNVEEWTADWNGPYTNEPQQDPTGPDKGTEHSYRGGGWTSLPKHCRSPWRQLGNGTDHASAAIGFRIALVSPPADVRTESGVTDKPSPVMIAPFTDAEVQRIAALPAEQQVEEVRKELMRRNPGFDGKMETKIEDDKVTEFRIATDKVADIAPIRVFNGLRRLSCSGTLSDKSNGLLADLTPLKGMQLTSLTVCVNQVRDLSPLNSTALSGLLILRPGGAENTDGD